MSARVSLINRSRSRPSSRTISAAVKEILNREAAGKSEVSVLLCDDAEIRDLNLRYRKKDRPTDVLSFSLEEGPTPEGYTLLGDVVISLETAKRQAEKHGHPLITETVLLAVHGTLHLLGYDDDTEENTQRMLDKAEEVARSLGHTPGGGSHD